jgi:hypothetical protein
MHKVRKHRSIKENLLRSEISHHTWISKRSSQSKKLMLVILDKTGILTKNKKNCYLRLEKTLS